ncbi:hypothetical protein MZD93_25990, partial [Escherichia coli]|nr:hypothetical protein [Escherichia coli]
RAYCLKTQPATGETYPKSDLFNKADVYIKAFKSTLELFDELVSCDLLTKRNAFGKLEINPIFENHFEWIMSEAFEIVGNHLGYNVPQIRKLMATICQMNLK